MNIFKILKPNSTKFIAIALFFLLGCQNHNDNAAPVSTSSNSSQLDLPSNDSDTDTNHALSINRESETPLNDNFKLDDNKALSKDEALVTEDSGYPKETCGTELPTQRRLYPLKIYPIFVEYSEEKLNSIKAKYCKDALRVKRRVRDVVSGKEIEKDSIQIASFVSGNPELVFFEEEVFRTLYPNKDLINLGMKEPTFLREVANKYGPIEKGEETIIDVPSELKGQPDQINYELAQVSQLSESQVQELLSIEEVSLYSNTFTLGIILPSYLPDGFNIDRLEVIPTNSQYSLKSYTISYRNNSNQCFSIKSWPIPPMGDAPSDLKRLVTSSDAFPNLVLTYIESDRAEGLQSINTSSQGYDSWNGFQAITFNSPTLNNDSSGTLDCKSITLDQAKSITESFQFLNP